MRKSKEAKEKQRAWRRTTDKGIASNRADQKRYYAKGFGGYNRTHYSDEEDAKVLDRDMSDEDLSVKLGRSMKSIHIRRHRLIHNLVNSVEATP